MAFLGVGDTFGGVQAAVLSALWRRVSSPEVAMNAIDEQIQQHGSTDGLGVGSSPALTVRTFTDP
jgi:hypothetical protein